MFTPNPKTTSPFLPLKPTSQSAMIWYKNQRPNKGIFQGLVHSMKNYYEKIVRTPETSERKKSEIQPFNEKIKLFRSKISAKSIFLRILQVYRGNSQKTERNAKGNSLLKPIALKRSFVVMNKELKKNICKRKFNKISSQKEAEAEEEEFLSTLHKKRNLGKKPETHKENIGFTKGLFAKMKHGSSRASVFKEEEYQKKINAKRGFLEIEEKMRSLEETDEGDSLSLKHLKPNNNEKTFNEKNSEKINENNSEKTSGKNNENINEKTPIQKKNKNKRVFLSENEKNKIAEEIEKYFKMEGDSLCKEKKVLLSIKLIESESPMRIEIEKKILTEEKSLSEDKKIINNEKSNHEILFGKQESNGFMKEKKEEITKDIGNDEKNEEAEEYEVEITEKNDEIGKKEKNETIENPQEIEKILKIENIEKSEKSEKSEKNEKNEKSEKNEKNPKTEQNTLDGIIIEEKLEDFTQEKHNSNPFLTSPMIVNFSLTDLINSEKSKELPLTYPQISSFERPSMNQIPFYQPQINTNNMFHSVLNNSYRENTFINNNYIYPCIQSPQIQQNQTFNIFAYAQQPWETQSLNNVMNNNYTGIDQKVACNLFNNHENANQQMAGAYVKGMAMPKKFKVEQQKLRVNSNGK